MFSLRILASLVLLSVVVACGKSDPRIKKSVDALTWSGGNANDQRIRDSLRTALLKATSASLTKPELVSVTALMTAKSGFLVIDWIGSSPGADTVGIRLPDGSSFDFPFSNTDLAENQKMSESFLFYHTVVDAQEQQPTNWKTLISAVGANAFLLDKSKVVSNGARLIPFTPAPPTTASATQPDTGKMIGITDSGGKNKIYLLAQDVHAGDAFAIKDVYAANFALGANPKLNPAEILDLSGPAAYVGRYFAAAHAANEPITTTMFTTPPTSSTNPVGMPH